jgi:hypothetical protein
MKKEARMGEWTTHEEERMALLGGQIEWKEVENWVVGTRCPNDPEEGRLSHRGRKIFC